MKVLSLALLALMFTCKLCKAEDVPQGAVDYFVGKYDHNSPDVLRVASVDFRGDGSSEFLMTFAKGDWKGPESVWTVVEFKDNHWTEPKTLDFDGRINDFSAMQFNPDHSGFIYLPSYKRRGLLARWNESWTFTYLQGAILQTVYFWDASQAGLSEEALKNLMVSNKIVVNQITVH